MILDFPVQIDLKTSYHENEVMEKEMSDEKQATDPPPVKKKRGRKPKATNINITSNKISTEPQEVANISSDEIMQQCDTPENIPHIIQIPKTVMGIAEDETNYEKAFCDYKPVVDVPNAYDRDDSFSTLPSTIEDPVNTDSIDFLFKEEKNESIKRWPRQTESYCLWCAHNFTNVPVGIPIKIFDDNFYCTGNFCSFACAAAHNYSVYDGNHDVFERNNLINLMATRFGVNTPVRCAKPREMLKIFGGDLDINQFRKNNEKLLYFSNKYPIMAVNEKIEEVRDTFNTKSSETFTIQKTNTARQKTMNDFV